MHIASTDTISLPGSARASAMATADLPEAVGPTMASGVGMELRAIPARAAASACGHRNAAPMGGGERDVTELAAEVVRSGIGDLDHGVGAGTERHIGAEVDDLVLTGPSRGHGRVLLARPLDEDLLEPADAGPMPGQGAALD